MKQHPLKLTKKTKLTPDVFELIYYSNEKIPIQPGQFFLCDCDAHDPKKKRSYSLSYSDGISHEFIIKRLENGTGGSRAICDQNIGHEMLVWGPLGDFVVRENPCDILFIGTGTGFAPLYFMIRSVLESGLQSGRVHFEFGVRYDQDTFYIDVLETLSVEHRQFSYSICLSKPSPDSKKIGVRTGNILESGLEIDFKKGYVTDILHRAMIHNIGLDIDTMQTYICGSPAMVSDARERLFDMGVTQEKVFFEQY